MGGSQGSSDWRSQGPWPREDGAHMGGCFCIPGERSLPWGPGEFPEGIWSRTQARVLGPGKAQGVGALEKLSFQGLGEGCTFWLPLFLLYFGVSHSGRNTKVDEVFGASTFPKKRAVCWGCALWTGSEGGPWQPLLVCD
jgi:hypothetical protein